MTMKAAVWHGSNDNEAVARARPMPVTIDTVTAFLLQPSHPPRCRSRNTVAKLREENVALRRETQETLPLGDVKIEPSRIGPVARWRLSEGGLLLAAGPRVSKLVARGGFDLCMSIYCR